jgi:membrane protein DedA with SNARE-associated domain/rhodanese-related sulfurtransferase
MTKLILLLQQHGLLIVFANVLLTQLGLPVPAYPILIVTGALALNGQFSWAACLGAALLACFFSDVFWYWAGRHYGKRVLALLCRISLSPDYCVSQTEDIFRRWGPKSLIISKFIPGFNTVAPPLAGALGVKKRHFFSLSTTGGALWASTGLLIGALFHRSIDRVLEVLSLMGMSALIGVGTLLGVFVLFKFIERQRFYQSLRMKRISVDEVRELIEIGHHPVLFDARSQIAQQLDAPIAGALLLRDGGPLQSLVGIAPDRHIIVYCSCPNDVSAAKVAQELIAGGFQKVRPLRGGLEAWHMAAMDAHWPVLQ